MDSFHRGWEFLKQSWKMALAGRDLIKPSIYTLISSYTMTAYHTCLYLWARDVERAQQGGSADEVRAPSPLAAVLP